MRLRALDHPFWRWFDLPAARAGAPPELRELRHGDSVPITAEGIQCIDDYFVSLGGLNGDAVAVVPVSSEVDRKV